MGQSDRLFGVGFISAIVLASVCLLLSGVYLFSFESQTKIAIASILNGHSDTDADSLKLAMSMQLVTLKIALLSCGMFTGMSFGFLGFALFLIGIRGEIDASAHAGEGGPALRVTRMAPGVFVILCATILVGVCATHTITHEFGVRTQGAPAGSTGDLPDETPILEMP